MLPAAVEPFLCLRRLRRADGMIVVWRPGRMRKFRIGLAANFNHNQIWAMRAAAAAWWLPPLVCALWGALLFSPSFLTHNHKKSNNKNNNTLAHRGYDLTFDDRAAILNNGDVKRPWLSGVLLASCGCCTPPKQSPLTPLPHPPPQP